MSEYSKAIMATPINADLVNLRPYFLALRDEPMNACCFMATKPVLSTLTWHNFSYHVIVPKQSDYVSRSITGDRAVKLVSESKTDDRAEYRKYGKADSLEKLQERKMIDKLMLEFERFHIQKEKSLAEMKAIF